MKLCVILFSVYENWYKQGDGTSGKGKETIIMAEGFIEPFVNMSGEKQL